MDKVKIILSGGGTGGHIYPAVAVAEELGRRLGERLDVMFVGAEGKMEMEKIPALGYRIEGLPIDGLHRSLDMRNLKAPLNVVRSLRRARRILKDFGPDAVAGFGGYASAPVLWAAQRLGIPTLIQEQNSYAGLTNKLLGRRACEVCVAYEGMDRFFPAGKITLTGNPLRGRFGSGVSRKEALEYFGLRDGLPTLLVLGGSLGSRTLNETMKRWAGRIAEDGLMQVIWQTGRYYAAEIDGFMQTHQGPTIWHGAFIDRMDYAYRAADLVISRAGACTVSELCLEAKPVIFIPSPNVAEDHQTKNASALSAAGAARMIADADAAAEALPLALSIITDAAALAALSANIARIATPEAARHVADRILHLTGKTETT